MGETSRNEIQICDVLRLLSPEERRIFRNVENIKKKITNASFAVIFNRTCIRENLLPNFTNIRLYDRAVQQSKLTQEFRKKLVEEEIQRKKELLRNLYVEYSEAFEKLKSITNVDIRNDVFLWSFVCGVFSVLYCRVD